VLEGPFASNKLFIEMLLAATGRPVEAMAASQTGTSIGAALLADMKRTASPGTARGPFEVSPRMTAYAQKWRHAVSKG
jgi:sugar (pentulose or hexulose) kinase